MAALDARQHPAIRGQLQSVEDDLMAAGKLNVTVHGAAGVLTWVLRGAGRKPVEHLRFVKNIREIEDLIIAAGYDHIVQMLQYGTSTWRRRYEDGHCDKDR